MGENVKIPIDYFEYYVRQDERLRILCEFIESWEGDVPLGILYMVMNEKEESVSPHIEIETETFKKVAGDFKVHMDARSASDV